jgi:hypothetical protein
MVPSRRVHQTTGAGRLALRTYLNRLQPPWPAKCLMHRLASRPGRSALSGGSNVSFSGGFVAHHRDDGSMCPQVTEDGRVLVAGVEFAAAEARFGGSLPWASCGSA